MGKTDGKRLDDGQGKDGVEMQLKRHGDKPGKGRHVVVSDVLALQWELQKVMRQVLGKGLQQKILWKCQ